MNTARSPLQFSLMFFASTGDDEGRPRYDFALRACDHADEAGLTAVWLPERHFHRFGGLFPNPAVLAAAIATRTRRLRLRAGSVILPLHDPLRVAEEWCMVDNLSGGRVDLAFGQGWNPNDFVLQPESFPHRLQRMQEGIAAVRELWSGRKVSRLNGTGQTVEVGTFPRPVQADFDTWITCSGGPERYAEAGRMGAKVLTALLFQSPAELQQKIAIYRQAWAEAGHGAQGSHVTVMLHTYIGQSMAQARQAVQGPLRRYLADSIDLWKQQFAALGGLGANDQERALDFAFERYFRRQSLCGDIARAAEMAASLHESGVDEIACLIDFGVPDEEALDALRNVSALSQQLQAQEAGPTAAAALHTHA